MSASPSANPRICAIVVTFKRQELLRSCLQGLQEQTRPADEILVVDNQSSDGTLEMLAAEFPGVSVLALPGNMGGAGGFHAGMKQAYEQGFDWLWVMDDDGRPAPDCLELMAAQTDAFPDGVLGPLCVLHDDPSRLSFAMPSSDDEFGGRTDKVEALKNQVEPSGVIRGWACFMNGILFPRSVVAKLGLPRAEMFIWGDEVEYAKRISTSGITIYTVYAARHLHPPDKIPYRAVLRPDWMVYAGKLDWRAFCIFRNVGLLAKKYGRGKGISVLVRYFYYYLVDCRFDLRSLRFFLRAYCAGWREDFSRKVPF